MSSIVLQPPNRALPAQRRRNIERLGMEEKDNASAEIVGGSNSEYNSPDPNTEEYGSATLCGPRTVGTHCGYH